MSMIIGRKQIILAALVIALGAAIFLNWRFSAGDNLIKDVVNASSSLGDTAYVNGSDVTKVTASSADYFATAKLSREQARGDALDMLKNEQNDAKATETIKNQVMHDIEALSKNITLENNVESLIMAKGFKNCVAIINDNSISVVVKPKTDASLSASDVIQIKDIVVTQTKISADKINIIQAK